MIIVAVGVKGGIGKSTIAVHMAAWIHHRAPSPKITVLDADPQRASTTWLKKAVPSLETFQAIGSDEILETLPVLSDSHDFVLCDGAAGDSDATRSLLLRADLALLPCTPSVLDLNSLADTARLVKQARSIRQGPPRAVVVMNRMVKGTILSREVSEGAALLGLRVAGTVIHQRAAVADAPGQGALVFNMGYGARDSAQEFNALFEEVISDEKEIDNRDDGGEGTGISGTGSGIETEPGPSSGAPPEEGIAEV